MTEFYTFVTFSHGEVITESDYNLRRSDIAINTFARDGTNLSFFFHCYGTENIWGYIYRRLANPKVSERK